MSKKSKNIDKRSWQEFKRVKLLWWVNRSLHLFGWALIAEVDKNGFVTNVYPARVKFRGFSEKVEQEGFRDLSDYIEENIGEISDEANE